LDSDVESGSNEFGSEARALEFANDVIVTPPMSSVKTRDESPCPSTVKRNLGKSFDKVADGRSKGRLKKIKVEKE
jgi:hypothetical protein